jgi:hypothetical protein
MRISGCVALSILLFGRGLCVGAQDRSSMEVQLKAGQRNSVIEGTCSNGNGQFMIGGSFRYHLTSRTSVGPEVLYVHPCNEQGFTFYHPAMSAMVQVTYDLSEGARVRPYLIAGLGVVHHRTRYAANSTKPEGAGGAGVRIFATKRVFIAPEIQVGAPGPAFIRFNVGVGFMLR